MTTPPKRNARLLWMLRLVVPLVAIAYLLNIVPLSEVLSSMTKVAPSAIAAAGAVMFSAMVVGTLRWRLLARACGVDMRVGFLALLRVYLIGAFYNSYVPGGVGGDVVRAVGTRHAFGAGGMPASLAVVLLERLLGLTGLLLLMGAGFFLAPLHAVPHVMAFSGLGLLLAGVAMIAIVNARHVAAFLPARIARVALQLPAIQSRLPFVMALGLSVLTQLCGVISGHLIISSISGAAAWGESLVVLPLINAAQYFPLTVGGAGVREAGFVLLYGLCGVEKSEALAASLVFAATQYAVTASGGILHALKPLAPDGS